MAALAGAALLMCGGANAEEFDYASLATRPDAEVTTRIDHGRQLMDIRIHGVLFSQQLQPNGKVYWLAEDQSGHGAVGCIWMLYVELKYELDACFPNDFVDTRRKLADDLDAIDDFIVANNLTPVTKEQVERAAKAHGELGISQAEKVKPLTEICGTAPPSQELRATLDFASHVPDRAAVEKGLLSVPRPPVNSPCL